jgi:hypothetical protein
MAAEAREILRLISCEIPLKLETGCSERDPVGESTFELLCGGNSSINKAWRVTYTILMCQLNYDYSSEYEYKRPVGSLSGSTRWLHPKKAD